MRIMGWTALLCLLPVEVLAQGAAPTALSVATDQDFYTCDGYFAPGLKYDGMQKGAWFGATLYYGDKDPSAAIVACDKALAEPMLADRYWLRRVSLIQAKAVHQIGAKAYAEALASLDRADAALRRPAVAGYQDPARIASQMLRAIALYEVGSGAEARASLRAVIESRPWSISLRSASRAIALRHEPDYAVQKALLREGAVQDAAQLHLLFWLTLAKGDFAETITYSRQLSFNIPRGRIGWTGYTDEQRRYDLISERASVAGATAYALTTLGDMPGSEGEYRRALADIEDAASPPPQGERALSRAERQDLEQRRNAAAKARLQLQDWKRAMDLRRAAPGLTIDQLRSHPDRPHGQAMAVAADFLRQARSDGTQPGLATQLSDSLRERFEQGRREAIAIDLMRIVEMLPRIDSGTGLPAMRGEGSSFFGTDMRGFAVRKADDPNLVNIRFGDVAAASATVEEATFLAAANYVERQGLDGFIVEANELVRRTAIVGGYTRNSEPRGWELRLLIRPVTVAALPPSEEASRWRVIKAADVKAALARKFAPTPSAK